MDGIQEGHGELDHTARPKYARDLSDQGFRITHMLKDLVAGDGCDTGIGEGHPAGVAEDIRPGPIERDRGLREIKRHVTRARAKVATHPAVGSADVQHDAVANPDLVSDGPGGHQPLRMEGRSGQEPGEGAESGHSLA